MPHCEAPPMLMMNDPGPGVASSPCPQGSTQCAGSFLVLRSLFQPLLKERDLKKAVRCLYSIRKRLFLSWQSDQSPHLAVFPPQVNAMCWASLNHLDSHVLYLWAVKRFGGQAAP